MTGPYAAVLTKAPYAGSGAIAGSLRLTCPAIDAALREWFWMRELKRRARHG